MAILQQLEWLTMDPARERLIQRAKDLNALELPVLELQQRVREVCSEFLIEAKVDVDRLLQHSDWRVRSAALDMVWWGVGATDGIDQSISLLLHDADEDIRAEAALALYKAGRNTPKQDQITKALKRAADEDESDYVRAAAATYLRKLYPE